MRGASDTGRPADKHGLVPECCPDLAAKAKRFAINEKTAGTHVPRPYIQQHRLLLLTSGQVVATFGNQAPGCAQIACL